MGGIIGGLLGIGSAAFSASLNARENYKQRQHQTSERVASQQWQDMQRREQNQFSESMYKRYQSPQAMVNQYRAAGLNPLLAVDGTAAPAVSSGSSGSAPMGGSTSAIPIMAPSTLSGSFQDIAGGLKALAEAKKSGVETFQLEKMFIHDLKRKQLGNEALQLDNYLKSVDVKWKDKETFARYQKLLGDISMGLVTQKKLEKELDILGLDEDIKEYVKQTWWQEYHARFDLMRSETGLNDTASALNEQEVKESSSRVRLNEQTYDINAPLALQSAIWSDRYENDPAFANYILQRIISEARSRQFMPEKELERYEQEISRLTKENNWYEARQVSNMILGAGLMYLSRGRSRGADPSMSQDWTDMYDDLMRWEDPYGNKHQTRHVSRLKH